MDTQGDVLLKYKCDVCYKRVMTSKGLKTHKSRMHEKSLQRIERERKQQFSCDECDIKRNTEILLKSHKKLVRGNIKRNFSEMRRETKSRPSPPSLSPPPKKVKEDEVSVNKDDLDERVEEPSKVKEDDDSINEEELEERINKLRNPKTEIIAIQKKEIDNLNRLLTASGEVISNLENENNELNAKAEFYEEVAEGLVTENENLLLKLKHQKEKYETNLNDVPTSKSVKFNLEPEGEGEEREEDEGNVGVIAEEETGFRQHTGRVRCIVCGLTRNTKSQMKKHMDIHKEEGDFIPANQIHCALVAYPMCPFQCSSNEDLLKHIDIDHKEIKCNFCSETFVTEAGIDKHRKKMHPSPTVEHPNISTGVQSNQKCGICGLIRDTQQKMDTHMKYHDDDEDGVEFWCKYCETRFETEIVLEKHIFENHKSHKPCREFAKNNCDYSTECRYKHIILQQGERICYKCGEKLKTQGLLMKHIKETHDDILCKNFLEKTCSYGTRCMFRHKETTAKNVIRPQIGNQAKETQKAGFWEVPTAGQSGPTVGFQRPVTQQEVMNMSQLMDQMMIQLNIVMGKMGMTPN